MINMINRTGPGSRPRVPYSVSGEKERKLLTSQRTPSDGALHLFFYLYRLRMETMPSPLGILGDVQEATELFPVNRRLPEVLRNNCHTLPPNTDFSQLL